MHKPQPFQSAPRINLDRLSVLLVDDNPHALELLAMVVSAFGFRQVIKAENPEMAQKLVRRYALDLVITDTQMPGMDGFQFIQWLRREAGQPNAYIPALIVGAHSRMSHVVRTRDCGAHFLVTKPITPKVLLDRIFWISKDQRPFIESDAYIGPDRRSKSENAPPDGVGRRKGDPRLALDAG